MVEIDDIVDEESLGLWLEGQPQRFSMVVSHRAAMRILPEIWVWAQKSELAQERGQKLLPFLRVSLISGISAYSPSTEMKPSLREAAIYAAHASLLRQSVSSPLLTSVLTSALASATSAATSSVLFGPSSNDDTPSAIISAASATHSSAYNAAFPDDPSRITIYSSDNYADRMWKAIRLDCAALLDGKNLSLIPLWAGVYNPLRAEWSKVKQTLATDDINWQFWVKWFEGAKSGMPLPWALLERIALEVTEADWKQGPQHVNGMIAEIELDFAVAATPNAELIVVNNDGKYASIQRSGLPTKTLNDTHARISDVVDCIRNCQQNSNQYSPLNPEADFLERQLEHYGNNPLRLHEACSKVLIHVLRNVTSGSLPENDNVVGDVITDLQNTADDIYNLDAEARATLDARERLRYDRLSDAQKADAVRIANAIAKQSTEELGEEMIEDGMVIAGESEPNEDTKSNRYRFVSRTLKIIAIGGAALVAVTTSLSQAEPAVNGAMYLWKMISPFLGL